jgi:prefoldin subunit 5
MRKVFGFEKPGEPQSTVFKKSPVKDQPASTEEKIDRHDEQMRGLQQEIVRLQTELAKITKSRAEINTTIGKSLGRKLDTRKLESQRNACDTTIMKLQTEIRGLETKQKELMEQNPRKKR